MTHSGQFGMMIAMRSPAPIPSSASAAANAAAFALTCAYVSARPFATNAVRSGCSPARAARTRSSVQSYDIRGEPQSYNLVIYNKLGD